MKHPDLVPRNRRIYRLVHKDGTTGTGMTYEWIVKHSALEADVLVSIQCLATGKSISLGEGLSIERVR